MNIKEQLGRVFIFSHCLSMRGPMIRLSTRVGLLLWILYIPTGQAASYLLPTDGSRLVGSLETHQVEEGEHLEAIAKQYNVGFLALLALNPGVDPYLPEAGALIRLPQQYLLPKPPHEGIVINLAELRLYYFPAQDAAVTETGEPLSSTEKNTRRRVHIFPIGIGRIGRDTPKMDTFISQKQKNPTWTPPQSIKDEYRQTRGISLPDVVPAGPDNPLGKHALRLGYGHGEYLIHGTNKSFGIGLRVSAGCIRLRPNDIAWLFDAVDVRTPVRIIDTPTKVSLEPDGRVMVEAHRPLSDTPDEADKRIPRAPEPRILSLFKHFGLSTQRYRAALVVQEGLPIEVASLTSAQQEIWRQIEQQSTSQADTFVPSVNRPGVKK